ncbi:30S ribosomal protein S3 [Candidatus Woesearchaeota archaeon]|nr:MAG: 30S ribosomal protein S3 [Candidatus Woesearchaeota archaeon]
MIERQFVNQKKKEFQIQEFIANELKRVGHSMTRIQRTPLGEKVIIHASRPGLVVGRKGANIKQLTKVLKKKFKLENPQIEIAEVENVNLDPQIVAERISTSLERYGLNRFKGIGHRVMEDVMNAGAIGVEILISGKVPSSRAKRWRFYQGYLKKSGDIAINGVKTAYSIAKLKTGVVGIQVRIMPPDLKLPDDIKLVETKSEEIDTQEPITEEKQEESETSEDEAQEQPEEETDKEEDAEKQEENGEKSDGEGSEK